MLKIDNKSVDKFWELTEVQSILPFGNGHINDTYLLNAGSGKFILQRVNKNVFLTKELVENYELLIPSVIDWQKKTGKRITPEIFQTTERNFHFTDSEGFAWRLVEFIPDALSYDICPNPEIAFKAAEAVGCYQLFLNTIDPPDLNETIVSFHDLPSRFTAFKQAVDQADSKLLKSSEKEISALLELADLVDETTSIIQSLPVRITHNDTKLNNVLFSGKEVLIIDLDTVMPGSALFDFGDMARTFTSPAAEDEKDVLKTSFRKDIFEALTRGYLEALQNSLTSDEKASLLAGALYILYEQALRFLTDFLNGSKYYKIHYPEHNLIRARTQLKLLKALVDRRSDLEKIIRKHC